MENSYCRRAFQFLGVYPDKPRRWLCIFNMSILLCMISLATLKYCVDKDSGAIEGISGLGLISIKYPMLILGSNIISQLLQAREQFWKLDVTDNQVTFLQNHSKRVEDIFKPMVALGAVMYVVKPFLIKGASMCNCYVFPQIPSLIRYTAEFYVVTLSSAIFSSFNIFVCTLIISVVVQFRYLNLKLEALDCEDVESDLDLDRFKRNLRSLVRHQQFLMRYVEELDTLLSIPLALLMVSTVSLICMNMYIISTHQASLVDSVKITITSFLVIFEFFMVYGLPAQLLMDESTATADTIYCECKWYLPKLRSLRTDFLFMILRSQTGVYIRAGNYHVINNNTIVVMVKTAYSFFTFLQNIV